MKKLNIHVVIGLETRTIRFQNQSKYTYFKTSQLQPPTPHLPPAPGKSKFLYFFFVCLFDFFFRGNKNPKSIFLFSDLQHVFDTVKEPQKHVGIDDWMSVRGKSALPSFESRYSTMDQVKFVEDSFEINLKLYGLLRQTISLQIF